MKIEKLSSNKIRVTVTPSELTVWDINPQAISPDSPQLKEFIASLLAQSAEETGFDLASTSILVEARPQGNDFVFVITQLAYGIEETRKELTRAIIRKKLLSGQYRAKSSSAPALSYFRFGSLTDFAAFWRAAGPDGMDGAVLYEAEGAYILGLRRAETRLRLLAEEFAEPAGSNGFELYLREHGRVFARAEDFEALARCFE